MKTRKNSLRAASIVLIQSFCRILLGMNCLPRRYIPLFFLVLLLGVFPVVGKTLDDLRRSTTKIVTIVWSEGLTKIFLPRAGEEELPEKARSVIKLLRQNEVLTYQLSAGAQDVDNQRVVEGAWPIRLQANAEARIYLSSETMPKQCQKRGEENGMVFALCR